MISKYIGVSVEHLDTNIQMRRSYPCPFSIKPLSDVIQILLTQFPSLSYGVLVTLVTFSLCTE